MSGNKKSGRKFGDCFVEKIQPRLDEVEEWVSNGLTLTAIAQNLGISRQTLTKKIKKEPELKKTWDKGSRVAVKNVESAVFKAAVGYTHDYVEKRVKKDKKGKIVEETTVTKTILIPTDATLAKYFLNNKSNGEWSDKQEIAQTVTQTDVPYAELDESEKKSAIEAILQKAKKVKEVKESKESDEK